MKPAAAATPPAESGTERRRAGGGEVAAAATPQVAPAAGAATLGTAATGTLLQQPQQRASAVQGPVAAPNAKESPVDCFSSGSKMMGTGNVVAAGEGLSAPSSSSSQCHSSNPRSSRGAIRSSSTAVKASQNLFRIRRQHLLAARRSAARAQQLEALRQKSLQQLTLLSMDRGTLPTPDVHWEVDELQPWSRPETHADGMGEEEDAAGAAAGGEATCPPVWAAAAAAEREEVAAVATAPDEDPGHVDSASVGPVTPSTSSSGRNRKPWEPQRRLFFAARRAGCSNAERYAEGGGGPSSFFACRERLYCAGMLAEPTPLLLTPQAHGEGPVQDEQQPQQTQMPQQQRAAHVQHGRQDQTEQAPATTRQLKEKLEQQQQHSLVQKQQPAVHPLSYTAVAAQEMEADGAHGGDDATPSGRRASRAAPAMDAETATAKEHAQTAAQGFADECSAAGETAGEDWYVYLRPEGRRCLLLMLDGRGMIVDKRGIIRGVLQPTPHPLQRPQCAEQLLTEQLLLQGEGDGMREEELEVEEEEEAQQWKAKQLLLQYHQRKEKQEKEAEQGWQHLVELRRSAQPGGQQRQQKQHRRPRHAGADRGARRHEQQDEKEEPRPEQDEQQQQQGHSSEVRRRRWRKCGSCVRRWYTRNWGSCARGFTALECLWLNSHDLSWEETLEAAAAAAVGEAALSHSETSAQKTAVGRQQQQPAQGSREPEGSGSSRGRTAAAEHRDDVEEEENEEEKTQTKEEKDCWVDEQLRSTAFRKMIECALLWRDGPGGRSELSELPACGDAATAAAAAADGEVALVGLEEEEVGSSGRQSCWNSNRRRTGRRDCFTALFITDVLWWGNCMLGDAETACRFFFLKSRFDEIGHEMTGMQLIDMRDCSRENLDDLYRQRQRWPSDALVFVHKEAPYVSGPSQFWLLWRDANISRFFLGDVLVNPPSRMKQQPVAAGPAASSPPPATAAGQEQLHRKRQQQQWWGGEDDQHICHFLARVGVGGVLCTEDGVVVGTLDAATTAAADDDEVETSDSIISDHARQQQQLLLQEEEEEEAMHAEGETADAQQQQEDAEQHLEEKMGAQPQEEKEQHEDGGEQVGSSRLNSEEAKFQEELSYVRRRVRRGVELKEFTAAQRKLLLLPNVVPVEMLATCTLRSIVCRDRQVADVQGLRVFSVLPFHIRRRRATTLTQILDRVARARQRQALDAAGRHHPLPQQQQQQSPAPAGGSLDSGPVCSGGPPPTSRDGDLTGESSCASGGRIFVARTAGECSTGTSSTSTTSRGNSDQSHSKKYVLSYEEVCELFAQS